MVHIKMTQVLVDPNITNFTQNPQFEITAEVTLLVCILKYLKG